jgi:hypothetical protein
VAFQSLAALVVCERDAAVLALNHRAAIATQERPGISAAIDENHGLRAFFEAQLDCRAQCFGDWRGAMLAAELFA